jgi:hypothetical protein
LAKGGLKTSTRLLPESETYRFPFWSNARPAGLDIVLAAAAPPRLAWESRLAVEPSMNAAADEKRRTRCAKSATHSSPVSGSTATAAGVLKPKLDGSPSPGMNRLNTDPR